MEDRSWPAGYRAIQQIEALYQLAHDAALVDLMPHLLDGDVLVRPRKIARVSFPGVFGTPPHQDAVLNKTPVAVLTVCIPLGDYCVEHGIL